MAWESIDTIANVAPHTELLKANGIKFVSRYIAQSSSIGKIMRRPEFEAIVASGLGVVVNYELSGKEWRGGYARGLSDGRFARSYARDLGLPDHEPIVQSVDEGVSDLGLVSEYQRGFNDGGGVGPQGVYGPGNVVQHLRSIGYVRVGWQWKDGTRPTVPGADVRQRYVTPFEFPFSYDTNDQVSAYQGYKKVTDQPLPPYDPLHHKYSVWPAVDKTPIKFGYGYAAGTQQLQGMITYMKHVAIVESGQVMSEPYGVALDDVTTMVRNYNNFFNRDGSNRALAIEAWGENGHAVAGAETWKIIDFLASRYSN